VRIKFKTTTAADRAASKPLSTADRARASTRNPRADGASASAVTSQSPAGRAASIRASDGVVGASASAGDELLTARGRARRRRRIARTHKRRHQRARRKKHEAGA
jgi:hypothetical protein